ncbi:helix-turn-helix domain-containing protein [Paenibacillus pini]|uniref:Transcriptional regulator in cluster with unspecified monosaccharide ABC transport system n=1 Tax=Paenibacillus pini JCM 16418 TaxID=1236976 RepID=W7YYQ1_9BACL|nr:RodZ family helix-turn-helix domain-containing protein [Paenibacillus pini]GAF09761.1 transcriptional regulator in cluster with unspecified monosaccharide ABC transport system [Paenibacillus pini JCM 16418]
MSELGQQLREARLQKGMSLDDVQEMTKIRKRYLEAIEAGDYKVLPGSFYVRAFIKTYAETVGLDPDELLEGHKQDVGPAEPETVMEPVIQKRTKNRTAPERNVKWLSTVLMWTFPILIIVVIYLYASHQKEPKVNQVDDSKLTNTEQNPATQPTPPVTKPQEPVKEPDTTTTPGTNPDGTTGGGTTGEDATNGTGTTTEPENNTGSQVTTVTPAGKKGKDTIFNVSAPQGSPVQIEIKATGKSWLEIYKGNNIHGEKLQFGNTEAGQTFSFTLDSTGIYIKSGYSPATDITVAGQPVKDGKSTSRILVRYGPEGDGDSTGQSTNSGNGTTNSDSNDESSTTGNN